MSYDLSDYVDVAERIREFYDKHPNGAIRRDESHFVTNQEGTVVGYFYRASAYRQVDDSAPAGVGEAYEPIPGKTQFTRDSEVMNAETSAWGRAIVAAGIPSKKIASANEVRARQGASGSSGGTNTAVEAQAQNSPSVSAPPAVTNGEFRFASGKHQGKTLAEAPQDYLQWYLGNGPRDDVKAAINAHLGLEPVVTNVGDPDLDIPFLATIDGLGN